MSELEKAKFADMPGMDLSRGPCLACDSVAPDRRLSGKQEALGLVMYGDPKERKTWSGTPANLLGAFRQLGVRVAPHNSSHRNYFLKTSHLVWNTVARRNLSFRRGGAARAYCARRVNRLLEAAKESVVLHLSLNHLPLPNTGKRQRHFLYIDFTDALRERYSAPRETSTYTSEMRRLDTQAYSEMDGIFCTSSAAKESLIHDYGIPEGRIFVVGTGFSREFLACNVAEAKYARLRLLFVCKVKNSWENKGGALLLEAFQRVHRQKHDATLTLVGRQEFHKFASAYPGVQAHSFVTFDQLLRLFEEASVFAMPALCEPWGLVYLEALASGTPVLGLPRLGFLDITRQGQYGFLATEPSAEAIASSLLTTFADRDELCKKGLAGREFVRENFSWEKTAREMLDQMLPVRSGDRSVNEMQP